MKKPILMNNEKSIYEFMNNLVKVARKIQQFEKKPRTYGTDDLLYIAEVHTLSIIAEVQPINLTDLARLTNKTKSAISQLIDKLSKKDLIIIQKNPKKYREYILVLSDKGKMVYQFHKQLDQKEYLRFFAEHDQYSDEELEKFAQLLADVHGSIDQANR